MKNISRADGHCVRIPNELWSRIVEAAARARRKPSNWIQVTLDERLEAIARLDEAAERLEVHS